MIALPIAGTSVAGKSLAGKSMTLRGLGVLVIAAVLIAACGGGVDEINHAELADTCDPKMEKALEAWADAGLSGSVTVTGGERQCSIGFGIADRQTGREVTADTAFSIGSITKAVTGAAILQLVDDGVLSLDDTAAQHVPGLTGPARDLVIRDLLLHISGLLGFHGEDHVPMTKTEAIEGISTLEMGAQGKYSYTNSGYALLGLIIEEVTGEGYRQYVADNILRDGNGEPLGGFWDGEPATPEPRAYGYRLDGSRGQIGEFEGPFWALEANGGIGMSTLELAEWTRAVWTGKILSPGAMDLLTSVKHQTEFELAELSGWGEVRIPSLKERVFSASGGGGSISHFTDTYWLPDTNRVFTLSVSARTEMTFSFAEDMLDPLLNGTGIPTPIPVLEADAAMTERMVGTYQLEGSSEQVTISTWENGLHVQSSGPQSQGVLFPLPQATDSEAARHEQQAVDMVDSGFPELQSELERIEAERASIIEITPIGTICCGLLTTFELTFEDGTTGAMGFALVNGQIDGGISDHPKRFVVFNDDGSYYPYRPQPTDSFQIIPAGTAEQPVLEIVGPDGTSIATKVT